MNWDLVIFYYLAFVIVITGILGVLSDNPVYTVLLVLIMIVHQAFLLLTLGSEFLTAIQIIVYAGAILVLFLFVVYLINLRRERMRSIFVRRCFFALVAFFMFFGFFFANLMLIFRNRPFIRAYLPFNFSKGSDVWWIANYLFKNYLFQFEVIGVILLVAILGSVFLIRKVKSINN